MEPTFLPHRNHFPETCLDFACNVGGRGGEGGDGHLKNRCDLTVRVCQLVRVVDVVRVVGEVRVVRGPP